MKTNIKRYITLALLIVLGASCSDNFLEEKKAYGLYDETFYESEVRVDSYVAGLYYRYFNNYNSPTKTIVGVYDENRSRLTEEIGGTQDLINPGLSFDNPDDKAIIGFTGYYGTKLENKVKNEPYHRIRDCNTIIENIDSKGGNLTKEYRDGVKGQMYYLRALQYFDLMRIYGGVPLVINIQGANSTDPSIQLSRASAAEVADQIAKDLDMAASLLPKNWNAANYGRFTKGAALAQKARVLLTIASPLFNKNWDTSTERWDTALQAGLAAETELTSGGYGLYGSNAKDWENMFSISNAFCKEAIVVQLLTSGNTILDRVNTWEKSIRLISQGGTGGMEAPKEMIDLFPMANGVRPTTANGYDDFLFFKNRDPRFYRTFSFSGEKWSYQQNVKPVAWAYRYLDAANKAYYSDNNNEASPAFVRKMSNTTASNASTFQYSGNDIFEYRYAELLLNIAECYAAKGDIANTVAYIGKVRNRVGIPSANNYGLGTLANKYAALNACLYERRVELAYEGKRFWDVQRWMLYNDDAFNNNNTCAKLGLTPINGTQRTGNYLQYKNVATATDPLLAARATISVDPDTDAATFNAQITTLANFYTANFIIAAPNTPMDNVNGAAVQIDWKSNYYIFGLQVSAVLAQNTWLLQTKGWLDGAGATGTYDYQQ